jgi:hypothetical protein
MSFLTIRDYVEITIKALKRSLKPVPEHQDSGTNKADQYLHDHDK